MKRILSIVSILLLAIILVACGKEKDPAQDVLDNAYDTIMVLSPFDNPHEIASDFSLPTQLAGGVTVEWSSSEPGAAAIGQPDAQGMVNVSVNRAPGVETKVVITAKLSIPATLSDKVLTRERKIDITILAGIDLDIPRGNIGEILAIVHPDSDPSAKEDKLDVRLENVTIFALGEATVAFGYDGTGIIQFYGGTNNWEVGKVYTVTGLLEWYFGIWEVIDPVATEQTDATPQFPTKLETADIDAKITQFITDGEHLPAVGTVADGNFEPIHAVLTGTIHSTGTGNYDFFLMDSTYDPENPGVPGEQGKPAKGFMFYYGTNDFGAIKAMAGFEVTIEVVIYTYRSNNNAFAIYYVGGPDGIELGELTDEQKVELDKNLLKLPLEVLETKEKALDFVQEGDNGTTISWELVSDHDAYVDLATGDVTIPETGQVEVTIKATLTTGTETDTKEFKVFVGAPQTFTLADAKDVASGRTIVVEGVVIGYTGNNTVAIQDETGGISLFGVKIGEAEKALADVALGDIITVTGKKTQFNGLHQIDRGYTAVKVEAGTMPAGFDLATLAELKDEALLPHQSTLVSLANVKVTEYAVDNYGNISMTLVRNDGQTIKFRWDARVEFTGSEVLEALQDGDFVNVVAAPLGWSKGAQLSSSAEGQIVKVTEISDAWLVAQAQEALTITTEFSEAGTLTLPTTQDTVAVEWALQNELDADVLDIATGAVTLDVEGFREVVLVATLTLGTETATKEFTVAIGVRPEAEMAYEFDFSTLTESTSYVTEPTVTEATNLVEGGAALNFVRENANISTQAASGTGIVLGLRGKNNFNTPYLQTETKIANLEKVEFVVSNWTKDASFNLNDFARAINVETSVDGETWTVAKDFKADWNVEESANNTLTVEFDNIAEPVFVRLIVHPNEGLSGTYQLRLIVLSLKIWA